jgi:hypothetical protein
MRKAFAATRAVSLLGAGFGLCALMLSACSTDADDEVRLGDDAGTSGASPIGGNAPGGAGAGSNNGGSPGVGGGATSAGRGGMTAGSGGRGGSAAGSGGSAQNVAGTPNGGTGGASAQGGRGFGARAGSSGRAGGGGRAGAGAGGAASGGAASGGASGAASGGSGGGCAQNLACKLAAPPSTGDPAQDCVDRINQFRAECACLPPLARWTEGEACANQHSEYDSTRDAHSGFSDNICMNGGSAQNECPGWRSTTEVVSGCLQAMWNEGPPPQSKCEGQCFQDHGHFINMTNTRFTKVACGFFTTSAGKVWSVQNFSR